MKRVILILVVFFTASFVYAETKTIIGEGIAYIGNGITIEDAQNVAINDARQKALNSLGAFFESQKIVKNGRITKNELSSMTGAIMKSKVIESKKDVLGQVFVLKLKVEFEVDMNSFNKALKKYQEESKDKEKIKKLISSLQEMQSQLLKKTTLKKPDFEVLDIVDEIVFTNKRMSRFLTAGQKIRSELKIIDQYKQRITIKANRVKELFLRVFRGELYRFDDVPREGQYFEGFKNEEIVKNDKYLDSFLTEFRLILNIAKEYENLSLKTKNRLNIGISLFARNSIDVYINDIKYQYWVIRKLNFDNKGGYYRGNMCFYFIIEENTDKNKSEHISRDSSECALLAHQRWVDEFLKDKIKVMLPEGLDYKTIETVDFRWTRIRLEGFKVEIK